MTESSSLPFSSFSSRRNNFLPGGLYGDLEPFLQGFRATAPLHLNAEKWRRNHPGQPFEKWRKQAKAAVLEALQYHPGPLDLQAETLETEERDGFTVEKVRFNTASWSRVEGWFLRPEGPGSFPALLAMHSWGGPMLLGKDRMVSRGKEHPKLRDYLDKVSGRFIAEDLAKMGYAVLAIDAYHFGSRLPWGARIHPVLPEPWLPGRLDPLDLEPEEFERINRKAVELLFYSVKYLNWAGTTWAGVNFWDDSRCIDYLVSRPEVDASRIGCFGQSGGGWRTHLLAGLDERVAASVSSCWMTTGDWSHLYNFAGTIGTFNMLPGLWRQLDVPDLAILAAPRCHMVISGQDDMLFTPEAMEEAARQIRDGFGWAGVPEHFRFHYPKKPHSFDRDNQLAAWEWFHRWLKPGQK